MEQLPTILSIFTVSLGVFTFLYPAKVAKLIGLKIDSLKGYNELRAVYSGSFIGPGAYALILGNSNGYEMLAFMWLGTGVARLLSILISKTRFEFNTTFLFLFVEFIVGLTLIYLA